MPLHRLIPFALIVTGLGPAACSTSADKPQPYESARSERPLEVPPDLTSPSSREALQIPEVAPRKVNLPDAGGDDIGEARVMRDGAVRWLEIDAAPAAVWTRAKRFLQSQDFQVLVEAPELGILETDWRETRPTGFLAKLMNSGSGTLDKFRVRLEPTANGDRTQLYLSHRGMQQAPEAEGDEPAWIPRPSDPELEAEMSQRLLVFLGGESPGAVADEASAVAELVKEGGQQVLILSEGFPRAWRRTGLALDRIGVVVADRDRSNGVYYIRLPDSYLTAERIAKSAPRELRIALEDGDGRTRVQVFAEDGGAPSSAVRERLLTQLREQLG